MPGRPLQISPSLMCVDFLRLEEEIRLLEAHRAEWLHIDVMDGRFVPNFALGLDFCGALVRATRTPLDVHLMIEEPERHVEVFCKVPSARVTFHPEASKDAAQVVERIRALGCSPGIAISPDVPVKQVHDLISLVDQVTVMTVRPGYAGQKLLPHCLPKISEVLRYTAGRDLNVDIEVDGNVSWENMPGMIGAGANVLVLGTSALFEKHRPRVESIREVERFLAKFGRAAG